LSTSAFSATERHEVEARKALDRHVYSPISGRPGYSPTFGSQPSFFRGSSSAVNEPDNPRIPKAFSSSGRCPARRWSSALTTDNTSRAACSRSRLTMA